MFTLAVLYRIGVVPQSYRFQREDPAGDTKVMPLMNEQFARRVFLAGSGCRKFRYSQ